MSNTGTADNYERQHPATPPPKPPPTSGLHDPNAYQPSTPDTRDPMSLPPDNVNSPWYPPNADSWAAYSAYVLAHQSQNQGGGGGSGGGGGGSGGNAKQRAKVLAAEISDRAKQLGLSFTDEEIANIAKWAVKDNWSQTVIDDALLIGVDWQKVTGGDLTAGADLVKQIGANYLVPLSTDQAHDYSLRIAKGELTQQGVTSMLQQQTRARWSWMGDLIDQGVKPSDFFAPVQNMIANTLEVAPDTINLMDPRWVSMVEVRDPKTGQTRAATLNEAMLGARQKPEWQNTRGAQEYAAQAAQMLGNIFGRAA